MRFTCPQGDDLKARRVGGVFDSPFPMTTQDRVDFNQLSRSDRRGVGGIRGMCSRIFARVQKVLGTNLAKPFVELPDKDADVLCLLL